MMTVFANVTAPLASLGRDGWLLFGTRCLRLFGHGLLSVVLVLYLAALGLPSERIGVLLTLTMLGDTAVSLAITTRADRTGRRRMLSVGAGLMVLAAAVFSLTDQFGLLLLAATIGVISPSGNEVGPFLSIEQAALAQVAPANQRTGVFAWYNLVGSFATAAGSLCGGALAEVFLTRGYSEVASYRPAVIAYGVVGGTLALLFSRVSRAVEPPAGPESSLEDRGRPPGWLGLAQSARIVRRLASLFALDALGGGFVVQSVLAYWFHLRFGIDPVAIGAIFFGANLLAGVSHLLAAWVAARIGLVNTMVFTHLPSNVLLLLVPLMPNAPLAVAVLLLRFAISQMDVPARQSYTMAVVRPEERSAAAGVTGVARSLGASVSPFLATLLVGSPALMALPFFLAGGIKIAYDLLLYRDFKAIRPEHERADA